MNNQLEIEGDIVYMKDGEARYKRVTSYDPFYQVKWYVADLDAITSEAWKELDISASYELETRYSQI